MPFKAFVVHGVIGHQHAPALNNIVVYPAWKLIAVYILADYAVIALLAHVHAAAVADVQRAQGVAVIESLYAAHVDEGMLAHIERTVEDEAVGVQLAVDVERDALRHFDDRAAPGRDKHTGRDGEIILNRDDAHIIQVDVLCVCDCRQQSGVAVRFRGFLRDGLSFAFTAEGSGFLRRDLLRPYWRDKCQTEDQAQKQCQGFAYAMRHCTAPPISFSLRSRNWQKFQFIYHIISPVNPIGKIRFWFSKNFFRFIISNRESHGAAQSRKPLSVPIFPALIVRSRLERSFQIGNTNSILSACFCLCMKL